MNNIIKNHEVVHWFGVMNFEGGFESWCWSFVFLTWAHTHSTTSLQNHSHTPLSPLYIHTHTPLHVLHTPVETSIPSKNRGKTVIFRKYRGLGMETGFNCMYGMTCWMGPDWNTVLCIPGILGRTSWSLIYTLKSHN